MLSGSIENIQFEILVLFWGCFLCFFLDQCPISGLCLPQISALTTHLCSTGHCVSAEFRSKQEPCNWALLANSRHRLLSLCRHFVMFLFTKGIPTIDFNQTKRGSWLFCFSIFGWFKWTIKWLLLDKDPYQIWKLWSLILSISKIQQFLSNTRFFKISCSNFPKKSETFAEYAKSNFDFETCLSLKLNQFLTIASFQNWRSFVILVVLKLIVYTSTKFVAHFYRVFITKRWYFSLFTVLVNQ